MEMESAAAVSVANPTDGLGGGSWYGLSTGVGCVVLVLVVACVFLGLLQSSQRVRTVTVVDYDGGHNAAQGAVIAAAGGAQVSGSNWGAFVNSVTLSKRCVGAWVQLLGPVVQSPCLVVLPSAATLAVGATITVSLAGAPTASVLVGFSENSLSFARSTFNAMYMHTTTSSGAGQDFTFVVTGVDGQKQWAAFGAARYNAYPQ